MSWPGTLTAKVAHYPNPDIPAAPWTPIGYMEWMRRLAADVPGAPQRCDERNFRAETRESGIPPVQVEAR